MLKSQDLDTIDRFIKILERFKQEKMERWEKVDDKVQSNIRPGSPSEDWINPPDENIAERELMKDPIYRDLKEQIQAHKKKVIDIAHFVDGESINTLQWLNFQNPLIGNVALDDSIDFCKHLKGKCEQSNYWKLGFKKIFRC